ncbi:hypothetical protein O1611_g2608 [Lasiodiplodia mahajangana]|uniref:Uncharacterized protein n=1 Tax=Lasiodiplodia mahajangana TaxID=1108764 RepID=A0ACC2JU87_9PEZI|nr:hypothetical protein O1611_g2608 [Lasiodiplodia mahajangana]
MRYPVILGGLFAMLAAGAAISPLGAREALDPHGEDKDDDSAIVYNYNAPAAASTIASPGTSGSDDDDAIAYT